MTRALFLGLSFLVFATSSCAQQKVYDLVQDKDIKPKKMFKKGNYITDIYAEQYLGTWQADEYTMTMQQSKKEKMDDVFIDVTTGTLTKTTEAGAIIYQLKFKLYSGTKQKATALFTDFAKYSCSFHPDSENTLIVKFEVSERVIINGEGGSSPELAALNIVLPDKLTFVKK